MVLCRGVAAPRVLSLVVSAKRLEARRITRIDNLDDAFWTAGSAIPTVAIETFWRYC